MKLPFSIAIAVAYGLILRLTYGFLNEAMEIMSVSFLFLSPAIIGFLTVIFLDLETIRDGKKAFGLPWITTAVILVITIAVSLEGAICWVMIYPFFSLIAGIGGVLAYHLKWRYHNRSHKNDGFNLSVLALLPLAIGFFEQDKASATKEYNLTSNVTVDAPASVVWEKLTSINYIWPAENKSFLTNVAGFPRHTSTVIHDLKVGGARTANFEKGLFFNETITNLQPARQLVLTLHTDPDKIPKDVLDEHVVIGGRHIDIMQDTYQLENLPGNKCRLTLSSNFKICTPFNWYAIFWAKLVISNILRGELDLIKNRADASLTKK